MSTKNKKIEKFFYTFNEQFSDHCQIINRNILLIPYQKVCPYDLRKYFTGIISDTLNMFKLD